MCIKRQATILMPKKKFHKILSFPSYNYSSNPKFYNNTIKENVKCQMYYLIQNSPLHHQKPSAKGYKVNHSGGGCWGKKW